MLIPQCLLSQESGNSTFFNDINYQIKEVQEKIISLAEAIPAEKYTWRPADSLRTVSEVLMHG